MKRVRAGPSSATRTQPEKRPMSTSTFKLITAQLATMIVTLVLAILLVGGRVGAERNPGLFPRPVPVNPPVPAPPPPRSGPYELKAVPAPSIPADLLKKADVDEQINIQVYAAVNRSVVNITTA